MLVEEDKSASVEGSGAIAKDQSVAAGERGIATQGDVSQSTFVTGDHNVLNVTYQGIEVRIPSPTAIASHRAALRQQLEKDAQARWGGMSTYIQEEGATLPIEASPYQTGRLGPRENLLRMLHSADWLLVLGEPGSGKTVALERLAWELCDGPEPTIAVLVRLFQYDGKPLAEWVRTHLQECGYLRLDDERALTAFLQEGEARCIFLFDGLNEVSPPHRDALVGELVRWMKGYPRHSVILTSRSQDELWRRLRGDVNRAVVLQPISDEQARAYLVAHLDQRGRELYGRLDRRLREMACTPLILWLIKEAGAAGETIPGNRGELYAHFVSRMLRRDTARRMDAEIPERFKRRALAHLAFHLSLDQRLSCQRDEAVGVVTQELSDDLSEKVIGACQRHGLLAGEETMWFAPHQTVQEHFAALALLEMAGREWGMGRWARLGRAGRQILTGQKEGLALLAGSDWWMETFVQLAGLTDNADRLAGEVSRVNPWLAWWCVEEGGSVSEETRQTVAARSVQMLGSDHVANRRRAVAALARMHNERVVHPLFRAAGDADAEVVGVALQALLELGEAARRGGEEALRGMDRRSWHGALRYLGARPDDPLWGEVPERVWPEVLGLYLVWVPPGPFLMGSDKDRDPGAYEDELPQHQVTLPGYWIGRYPVTVAQFRAFVQASGYEPRDSRSLDGEDGHPVRYVTWHDARAYCRWLGEKAGLPVALPTEAEWEKAARGTEGRIYPWGDELPDESRCNFGHQVGGTTPVGRYSPRGDSPYGCADMAGNVWEWCHSLYRPYPYHPQDGREDLKPEGKRVLRGGAFLDNRGGVRCACRYWADPSGRNFGGGGFRICVAPGYASGLWGSLGSASLESDATEGSAPESRRRRVASSTNRGEP
jgi:formylglycine-generating enzyme required for sulfatase activity